MTAPQWHPQFRSSGCSGFWSSGNPRLREHFRTTAADAFTLVELLVVIAIIGMIAALSAPALSGFQKGMAISDAAEKTAAAFRESAQTAVVRNRVAAVRFYKLPPPDFPSEKTEFRAVQVFCMNTSGALEAVSNPVSLGLRAIITDQPEFSPMLTGTAAIATTGTAEKVGTSKKVPYVEIAFYPNRRTSLPVDQADAAYLTIWGDNAKATPPPNFAVLAIEPGSGKCRILRP